MQAKRDTYQLITDRLLAAMEACGPLERPWIGSQRLGMPTNETTGRQYRGTNVVMLWMAAQEAGYADNRWATFKQWGDKGAKVRKGETGTPVLFFTMLDRKDKDAAEGDDEGTQRIPCAKISWVFNIAQVDGYTAESQPQPEENQVSPMELADALFLATGANFTFGDSAYYQRSTDQVVTPPPHLFVGSQTRTATEAYYAIKLHELVHWTGPRLDRKFGERFGDNAYAFEELVAELGSAFLCATLGITDEPRADHAAYLKIWADILREDKRAFTTAAARAAEAVDYLLAFTAQAEVAAAA